ncbi:MAG: hypothetical protein Fur0021_03010 [Candidatus Promineifilaceae bacterium]
MHTISFYSELAQTNIWRQTLQGFMPADFQLQAPRSAGIPSSVNGNGHAPYLATPSLQPSLLLYLTDLSNLEALAQLRHKDQNVPVIYAGLMGRLFQIGPGVIHGQTACLACLGQQGMLFPGIIADAAEAMAVSLTAQTITQVVERLATELMAFARGDRESLLRRGYLLRRAFMSPHNNDASWQIYRGLRDPYCEICSQYAQYPSEAIYTK